MSKLDLCNVFALSNESKLLPVSGSHRPRLLLGGSRSLDVVSSSAEFETIPVHRHEDIVLRRIYDRVPVKLERADFEAPHFKTFLLLQAHFSCIQLSADLSADRVLVLGKVLNLPSACVAVMSSNAWLSALGAMDLSQIPLFEPEVIRRRKDTGINSVYDIMEMEDDKPTELLQMDVDEHSPLGIDGPRLTDVSNRRDVTMFINSYPTLDVSFELEKGEHTAGAPILMHVAPF
ncbi:hypothetical protein PAXINDRAFT_12158 [Paxillus involutus ATCC 200175]|uniref:SEC63 domain-containing protein n=1 Tax=Paxillus involutus ATCC 200175 TaxID=664439 RepID=A0A0C9U763_PAXIN|nr:hypothetical protein PAXINDRAFT_12158 [Paxillus involutus ATCC 200175]